MSRINRRHFLGLSSAAAGVYILSKSSGAAAQDTRITHAKIHPAIGVARIGNSPDGFYVGPEVTEPKFISAKKMRDKNGALKRQAARFRVYGYNASGEVVRELTADEAEISWQVHMANRKAEWFRFIAAMDIAESANLVCPRRNAGEPDRVSLVIDPGSKMIEGKKASPVQLDGGRFKNVEVNLGELRTDSKGRLLVLGGQGKAASVPADMPPYDPEQPDTFNNADGWYDDSSDGPVSATVMFNGGPLKCESAWVIVAPPNYAPDVIGWRTMYDMIVDSYVDAGRMRRPQTTSFTNDILPILRRLSGLQWVNQGFEMAFGRNEILAMPQSPNAGVCKQKECRLDFDNPAHIKLLSEKTQNPSHAAQSFREQVYKRFRIPDTGPQAKAQWPMLYGDAYGTFDDSEKTSLFISKARAEHLKRWVQGEYDDDWNILPGRPIRRISQLLPNEQPAMLDKAALHFCLADAFHPGCELTWPMRHISMFDPTPRSATDQTAANPFRIRRRLAGEATPKENQLTAGNFQKFLQAQGPGDLTKWMAVPWQGDTIFCRSGYEPEFDPFIQTYWPARVPNHVLSEADYKIVMDKNLSVDERLKAYRRRKFWTRSITGDAPTQIKQMVSDFGQMGIIEARPGYENDPNFPAVMLVESLPANLPVQMGESGPKVKRGGGGQQLESTQRSAPVDENDPIIKAGWESAKQLEQFRRLRGFGRR